MNTNAIRSARRGFTLIELLVVISIIVIMTSILIPIMSAAADSRRLREGARLLNTYLSSAQARALASGRSVGVMIQRLKSNPTASMDLFLCEVPPPYCGDALNSTAVIANGSVSFPQGDLGWKTVRPGDLIRFNYRGQFYYLDYGDPANPPYITSYSVSLIPTSWVTPNGQISPDPTTPLPPNSSPSGVPFQVYRQPIKSSDAPAQLADGAVVDFNYSGIDATSFVGNSASFATDNRPVIVTFSATGSLDSVYVGGQPFRPLANVFFLIGKVDKVPPVAADPTKQNLSDLDCRWVAVSRQSGLVTTAEVAPANAGDLVGARRFARGNQNMVGQ